MSTQLARYDAARQALAEASRIDEVKDIRDKAMAMKLYAQQAKDRELIELATEIRLRAERRAGEMLKEMAKNKGTRGDGRPSLGGRKQTPPKDETPSLANIGITKQQSSRWQKLANMPDQKFEEKVGMVKDKAVAAVTVKPERATKKKAAKKKLGPDPAKVVGEFFHELTTSLDKFCARLEAFVEATPDLNDECRGALVQVLELNSMRLQRLAQQIDDRENDDV